MPAIVRRTPSQLAERLADGRLVEAAPSDQNAVDLFGDTWASAIPLPGVTSGPGALFTDPRVAWLLDGVGPLDGMDVLELGALEGGHTAMLLKRGAAHVTAIEANASAFLRCLVAQNLLGLSRAKFMLGNFEKLLERRGTRFDLILASGVLYHLQDPLRVLQDIVASTDRVCIWSHFYDPAGIRSAFGGRNPFSGRCWPRSLGGSTLTYHELDYGKLRRSRLFRGGVGATAIWLELDEVVSFLQTSGFAVEVGHHARETPGGPAACVRATRDRS